jgi:tetratricopeptide (TPR) repeat protein
MPALPPSLRRPLLVLSLFAAALLCLQMGTAEQRARSSLPFAFDQAPPARLSPFSLTGALSGMRTVAADWIYIDMLQYYGDRAMRSDNVYGKLRGMFEEILWLDPYYRFAVLYGASILGWNVGRIDEALDLLEKAAVLDPGFHRYRLYIAGLTFHKAKDKARAQRLLEAMVMEPGRPEILVRTLGQLYDKNRDWAQVRRYYRWVKSVSTDPRTLQQAREGLKKAARHGY